MRSLMEWREARVADAQEIAAGVRRIEFAVPGQLPSFDPGSHINVRVRLGQGEALRTYTALPAPAGQLRIAVRLHEHSRGGSRFMWALQPGDAVALTLPENRFELSWRASQYLLVAGGIGITPIYGMAMALRARERPLRLVYCARSRMAMPFRDELARALGQDVAFVETGTVGRVDIGAEIATLPDDGELYACGPLGMLDAIRKAWAAAGRPSGRLRYEVFGDSGRHGEQSFRVAVLNRDVEVEVRPDQTMLDALDAAGIDMISDCQRGECGLCAVRVLECDGEIDHRDVFFSPEQRRTEKKMCACVSRLAGGRALIDIGYRR